MRFDFDQKCWEDGINCWEDGIKCWAFLGEFLGAFSRSLSSILAETYSLIVGKI